MECQQNPNIPPQIEDLDLATSQDTALALTAPFAPVLTDQTSKLNELSITPFTIRPDSQLKSGRTLILAHRPLSVLAKNLSIEADGDRDSFPLALAPMNNNAFPIHTLPPIFQNATIPSPSPNGYAGRIERSLEPGEIISGLSFPGCGQPRKADPEPNPIGSAELKYLTKGQTLFTFGVISIMAMLRPRFQFKYGGHDGIKIGARLTLYGHTILVEPVFPTVDGARVMGYRLALEEIKAYNPEWLLPPPPLDGPTGPEWDWIRLLEDYCQVKKMPPCHYNPTLLNNGQWHCEVLVGHDNFRTIREYGRMDEAQNTVAHTALHALLIAEPLDNPTILPADSCLLPEVTTKKQPYKLVKEDPLTFKHDSSDEERSLDTILSPGIIPAALKGSSWREKEKQGKTYSPPPLPPPARKPKSSTPPYQQPKQEKKRKLGNSNLVPLTNCRLADISVPEVIEDKLATLRAVQIKIASLGALASFDKRMKGICDVLEISYPDIRYKKDPNSYPASYTICAWFDNTHPYLHRASPILMATVEESLKLSLSEVTALGIKKVVMYLIWMLKDDAGVPPNDLEYAIQLRTLKNLEMEIESDLTRGKTEFFKS